MTREEVWLRAVVAALRTKNSSGAAVYIADDVLRNYVVRFEEVADADE